MQKRLSKILKNDITSSFAFPVSYNDGEETHNYNVFTDEQFRQIAKQLFGARIYNDWDDESTDQELQIDFVATFNAWKNTRSDTYGRRMYALSIKFEPLENYRSHEERSGSFTHGESIELSFDNRKDIQKDDSYTEKSYTNYKETEKDDSYIERSYDDLEEHTTDDSYIERSYDNFKETTKDDSEVTRSYSNYSETNTVGEKTTTNKVSADDATNFVNSNQSVESQHTDTKGISGSYTDAHSYDTIGNEKQTSGTYKDQHGYDENGVLKVTNGSYKDQHGFTNGNEKSITGTIKDQRGFTNGNEKSISGTIKDQHGFDSIGNEKSISGTIKDQRGFTNGIVDEKTGKETTSHSGTDLDGYTLERYGNIGVTTSQQMLASDLDLLRYDITMMAIREFISSYTYFSEEID